MKSLAGIVAIVASVLLFCPSRAEELPEECRRGAVVKAVRGTASFQLPGERPRKLRVGMVFREGVTVLTDENSVVDLFLGESGVVRLTPKTTLRIERLRAQAQDAAIMRTHTILDVSRGKILSSGPRQRLGAVFEIRTIPDVGAAL